LKIKTQPTKQVKLVKKERNKNVFLLASLVLKINSDRKSISNWTLM